MIVAEKYLYARGSTSSTSPVVDRSTLFKLSGLLIAPFIASLFGVLWLAEAVHRRGWPTRIDETDD